MQGLEFHKIFTAFPGQIVKIHKSPGKTLASRVKTGYNAKHPIRKSLVSQKGDVYGTV